MSLVISDEKHEAMREGGRKGSATRHDPRTYARSIVSKWPALDETVRAELRAILSPIVARAEAGRYHDDRTAERPP